ncbi:MAG TPA: EamA family transporter [Bryobacteraceae bacterium]|nr:EamA family transporter [Bryobacteraceae bacterium]
MNTIKAIALDGILLAIIAHGLIGISLIWDKVLLKQRGTQNLVSYVFWLGAISIFGLILIPFGFQMPSLKVAGLAFFAGFLDLAASFFYYSALKSGEASEELAAMGGFGPVFTALISIPLLKTAIGGDILGFTLMTLGGFTMFFGEKAPLKKMLPKIVLAAGGFGLMNVLQKLVFNQVHFVSGYVFFTFGTFIGSMLLLVPPSWRRQVFQNSGQAPPKSKFWYIFNRFLAGVGSFLVIYALSRTSPSLVQAITGIRYATIFVGAYLITKFRPSWFREDFGGRSLFVKALGTSLVIAGLILVGIHGGSAAQGGH